MSDDLRVNLEVLYAASNHVLDHVDMSRREHSGHEDDLAAGARRWNGEIAHALAYVGTAWAEKRADLHRHLGHIANSMSDAVIIYAGTDQDAADDLAEHGETF